MDSRKPEPTNDLNEKSKIEDVYDIPVGATTTDLPPGVLYKVIDDFLSIKNKTVV